jgi:putative ABC transport system permease protein
MIELVIAFRNIVRNRRRTIVTMLALLVGTAALLVFSGFISSYQFGMQTNIVRQQGHLHIYPKGFLEFGPSRPGEMFIENYDQLMQKIQASDIAPDVRVITPMLDIAGIAGNYDEDASKTFIGVGLIPSDYNRMLNWNGFNLATSEAAIPLTDSGTDHAMIGNGMARMLSLCAKLKVPDCADRPKSTRAPTSAPDQEIAALQGNLAQELAASKPKDAEAPRIDLLAASFNGAPNIISVYVEEARQQAQKQADDSLVLMNLTQAQKLAHGGAKRVTRVVIQLQDSARLDVVRDRLTQMLTQDKLDLEVRTFSEFNSLFDRVLKMFRAIFVFVFTVIALVILFLVVNTMTMSVMERIKEIGTIRALGVRRSGVRRQFVLEGALIGFGGATLGLVIASSLVYLLNTVGLTWTPPSSAVPQKLVILFFHNPTFLVSCWAVMIAIATLSALIPANRAARQEIVEAIRHV